MFPKFIFILFLLLSSNINAQKSFNAKHLKAPFATEKRQVEHLNYIKIKIKRLYNDDKNFSKTKGWEKILKEVNIAFYQDSLVHKSINNILVSEKKKAIKLRYNAIETAVTIFPNEFSNAILNIYNSTKEPLLFIISAQYLLKNNSLSDENVLKKLYSDFPKWESNSQLVMFEYYLKTNTAIRFEQQPDIKDLLQFEYQKDKTIIFSFFRSDRNYSGISIIRKPDGSFLRNDDSTLFHIPQLAISTSNLPGYLTNGNTPQGIFSIVGWYGTKTESIGPSPIILTRSPFEVSPSVFYHNKNSSNNWDKTDYKNLLQESWQNYLPIWEAYNAKRRLIIMHGSADNLDFYKEKIYYPLTPSNGCITAKEIWDKKTGRGIESDQIKLTNAFFSTGKTKGFLVVVELDNKKEAVSIKEIERILSEK